MRKRGVDAITTVEAGRDRSSDEEQLAFATAEGRVVVTKRQGLPDSHSQGVAHAGIVRWHSKHQSHGELINKLTTLWRTTTAAEMVGRVQYF